MKAVLIALLIASLPASAGSVASIYNGSQFNLMGQMLIQDADKPNDFYLLPQTYEVIKRSEYDESTGQYKTKVWANHIVAERDGRKYSVYTFKLRLREPTRLDLNLATVKLRRVAGPSARIVGTAPICGLSLNMPEGQLVNGDTVTDATVLKYSLRSTGTGCTSILTTTEFQLEMRAPLFFEPQLARDMTAEVGLLLPPLELILPYKYKDRVTLEVDAESVYEQMKAGAGMKGTLYGVKAGVTANMQKAVNRLRITGQIKMDCQNPDQTVCNHFLTQAQEILKDLFVKYTALGTTGGSVDKPLIVADQEKAVDASLFQVDMAMEQAEARHIGRFTIDFSNTVYSSIRSFVQLDVSRVPLDVIAPEVRAMMKDLP